MAVPALRVALGQLPVGNAPVFPAVLRPTTPRSPRWSKEVATDALAVAARQLPQGTFAASALSAAAGRAFLRMREKSTGEQGPLLADALAVAAQQQPQGTSLACNLAAAAGRAFLRLTGNTQHHRSQKLAGSALAVAASRLSPEYAAVILPASRQQSSCLRRRQSGISHKFDVAGRNESVNLLAEGLCQDTSSHVIGQLWPKTRFSEEVEGLSAASLSPRTFEARLRHSRPLFMDISRVSAVSPTWARHAERDGWPSAHAYLFQASGTKVQLQERYSRSMQWLLLKDKLARSFSLSPAVQGGLDNLVNRITTFAQ